MERRGKVGHTWINEAKIYSPSVLASEMTISLKIEFVNRSLNVIPPLSSAATSLMPITAR